MSRDDIVDLGDGRFGLLSVPSTRMGRTAVLILNAGLIHRSGPYRLGTRFTRALAASGYPALRFDLPGIGDSLANADQAQTDLLKGVLDRVQTRTGCTRFVLGGICAAADLGWQCALVDERVTGLFLLDGLAREGFWFQFARWMRLLRKPPSAWLAAAKRQLKADPSYSTEDLRDWPEPGSEREQLRTLVARDVQCLFLFTGGNTYFLHPRQFAATYGGSTRSHAIRFEHWPECDHTFADPAQRQRVIDFVRDWVGSRFPD